MNQWLIIGGTTRSGTTSTYVYLRDHPAICAATLKETGYFLGNDHSLPRPYRYKPSLEGYANLFPCDSADRMRMEASPQYLYSEGTAERIYQANPQTRMIFLLREPISRLVSWHKFGMLKGMLLNRMSFAEFIDAQHQELTIDTPYPLRAMAEGRYARYLARWIQVFSPGSVMVLKYSDLCRDPRAAMKRVAAFAKIDTSFYDDFHFDVQNASYPVRSLLFGKLYHTIEWRLRWLVQSTPLRIPLRDLQRNYVRPLYKRFNAHAEVSTEIPDQIRARLEEYYRDEPRELAHILGLEEWIW